MKINKHKLNEALLEATEEKELEVMTEAAEDTDIPDIDDVATASTDEIADAVQTAAEVATDGKGVDCKEWLNL